MMSMLNMKTLKHCENLFKVSNEIKEYVKIWLLNPINLQPLSMFSQWELQ